MKMTMTSSFRRHAVKGFTLIELLIVVIIIAILAAIAIPQFSNTAGDAQESALQANLSTMRSAIELYRVQHRNALPGVAAPAVTAAETAACTGANGTITAPAAGMATFTAQLTGFSNANGTICSVATPNGIFSLGPYLREIPSDGITSPANSTVVFVTETGANAAANPAAATGGWQYDPRDGRIRVNSNAAGRRGTQLFNY
jgi:prepilin-type N-terminal cleavage/methylation domain-containing protein